MIDYKQCIEWNKAFGNRAGDYDLNLEYRLIKEEAEETIRAIESNDTHEVIDGCIDVLFVGIGSIYKIMGEQAAMVFVADVYRKLSLRPENIRMINISMFVGNANTILKELKECCDSNLPSDYINKLIHLLYVSIYTLEILGLTMEQITEAFDIVCKSNMSKLGAKKNSEGKVMKGDNFIAPDFSKIIENL